MDLIVGTPPQRVSVIVDTGSGVTAFPCKGCKHCGHHIDPLFEIGVSSSAKWDTCKSGCKHSVCRGGRCQYHQGYTEGSSITGQYFTDLVRLGDAIQRNPPVNAKMGCHSDENRLFYTQQANGIMGIRPPRHGEKSVLQALFSDRPHVNEQIFALCFAEWGGRLVVGGHNASYHTGRIAYVPLTVNTGYYRVSLSMMRVGDRAITGFRSTMIDSGTTYVYMGSAAYRALKNGIEDYCRRHGNCDAQRGGTCWTASKGLTKFPVVQVMFNGVETSWGPKSYMYRKGGSSKWCYAFMDDGANANTVLGAAWMIHQDIIFDLAKKRVGIATAKCPEFRKRPTHDKNADISLPTSASVPVNSGSDASHNEPTQGHEAPMNTSAVDWPYPSGPAAVLPAPRPRPAESKRKWQVMPTSVKSRLGGVHPAAWVGVALASVAVIGLACNLVVRRCRRSDVSSSPKEEAQAATGKSTQVQSAGGSSLKPTSVGRTNGEEAEENKEEDPLVAAIES